MTVEQKAKKAAQSAREACGSHLLATMPKVKAAVLDMAEAVEALAHEVEILKLRAGGLADPGRDSNHQQREKSGGRANG